MTLAQAILQILCSQGPLWVKCLSLRRGMIQSNFDRILWKVNQIIYIMYPKQYAWYHDPSSSGSPDILFTRLLYYTKWQSRKREIIQSNSFGILPKVNQVIYTLETICRWAKYHDPSASGSRDILFTKFYRLTMGKSKKSLTPEQQFRRKRKNQESSYFSCLFHILNFKILSLTVLDRM